MCENKKDKIMEEITYYYTSEVYMNLPQSYINKVVGELQSLELIDYDWDDYVSDRSNTNERITTIGVDDVDNEDKEKVIAVLTPLFPNLYFEGLDYINMRHVNDAVKIKTGLGE